MTDVRQETQEITHLRALPDEAIYLGRGEFGWCRYERICDRYGTVGLWPLNTSEPLNIQPKQWPHRGRLVAKVLKVHPSRHIGDLFHGIGPGGAVEGELVVLNPEPGRVYWPTVEDTTSGVGQVGQRVGVQPDDGRAYFWLSVPALYRLSHQEVELYLLPAEEE